MPLAPSAKCPGVWGPSPQEHRKIRRRHTQCETETSKASPEFPGIHHPSDRLGLRQGLNLGEQFLHVTGRGAHAHMAVHNRQWRIGLGGSRPRLADHEPDDQRPPSRPRHLDPEHARGHPRTATYCFLVLSHFVALSSGCFAEGPLCRTRTGKAGEKDGGRDPWESWERQSPDWLSFSCRSGERRSRRLLPGFESLGAALEAAGHGMSSGLQEEAPALRRAGID